MFVARSSPDHQLSDHPHHLLALLRAETSHLRALLITGLVLAAAVLASITARPSRSATPLPSPAAERSLASK